MKTSLLRATMTAFMLSALAIGQAAWGFGLGTNGNVSGTHMGTPNGTSSMQGSFFIGKNLTVTGNATVSGNLTVTGTQTQTGQQTFTVAPIAPGYVLTGTNFNGTLAVTAGLGQATTFTLPDSGNATDTVATLKSSNTFTGATQTVQALTSTGLITANSLTVTGATTLTTPLTAANIQSGSAKRQLLRVVPCPGGGVAATNGTTYFGFAYPGRAGTVKALTYAHHVDTVSGTNTIKVLKASASGNTMLSTASISTNGVAIDTGTALTLTATGADLGLTAGQGIYVEYTAGTQGAAAEDETVTIEFEPTDF